MMEEDEMSDSEKVLMEEFVLQHGWRKEKGFKIDLEYIEDGYDVFFFPDEMRSEIIIDCEYYMTDTDGLEETATEDLDYAVEMVEDEQEITFEDWKKARLVKE